ncbi:hypothetical protein COU89_02005 [Candidatus Roizmanbacteria bacterium CG10_big_fil_rev_8_21_14_0_10_45_7]|uniref:Uncharacterized protein n=1 Tax=Candidatus Roizmanbacteria bacterium CG10_big_fil_rev_8_21_14_0_10_45_7 TaxID=1974854 RepID=A0A2M8KUZ7_9BACT|nr:MAG: hypothetical protein COU89_02005 [Candidatus Roizmanbacteria bacterium CG10_big_fil_rev_8_21_14_0_10_45_7]
MMVCDQHGEVGVMDKKYIGMAQIDHLEIFCCTGEFVIIPIVNKIIEHMNEQKTEENILLR